MLLPNLGGQLEHSHQSVFLTILIGGQPELFSRLLAISSGSEATGYGGSSASIV